MVVAVALSLTAPVAPLHAQVRLPALGESASDDLSINAERRLGDQIMREARRDPEYLDDPVLLEYLQSIWSPLVAAARQLGNIDADTDLSFAWEPFLVKDRSVNAFALPGGYVGAHLGLIALTSTPDQLASVLAHELSHVTQRHIARSIAPQQTGSMVALAAILLGIIAAGRSGNVDVANAAISGGQAAAIQGQLNFSRDMEREADRVGFGLLSTAGYSPTGMAAMFDRLDAATRLNDDSSFPYLRSHPLTVDRISEARSRTLLSPGRPSLPTLRHSMMQARSRVLMDDTAAVLQRMNGSTVSAAPGERIAVLYGAALAASHLGDGARAEAHATQALALAEALAIRDPDAERVLRLLLAEVRIARRDGQGALSALSNLGPPAAAAPAALPGQPATWLEGRPALLLRAQAALLLARREGAGAPAALRGSTEALQTWLADQPHDPLAWDGLSETSAALGLKLRAMRAAAEARAALGDVPGAIDRFRVAQAASRTATGADFIEASVIDSRLRQMMALRRQLVLESRGQRGGPEEPGP